MCPFSTIMKSFDKDKHSNNSNNNETKKYIGLTWGTFKKRIIRTVFLPALSMERLLHILAQILATEDWDIMHYMKQTSRLNL